MKTVKFYFFHKKLILAKSTACFLLLIIYGRHTIVYSIILVFFGFLKLKEKERVECLEAAGGGVQSMDLVFMKCRRDPSLGISYACGCLCISQIHHTASSLRKCGENIRGGKAYSKKPRGNRTGGPREKCLAQVLSRERDLLWERAHLCASALCCPLFFLHNSHISLYLSLYNSRISIYVGQYRLFQEAFLTPNLDHKGLQCAALFVF